MSQKGLYHSELVDALPVEPPPPKQPLCAPVPEKVKQVPAESILQIGIGCIEQRGKTRDNGKERSMLSTVKAFNAMFDKDLTEVQGWQFMELLKMSRSKGGEFNIDDYVDGSSYSALAGECASKDVD